MIYNLLANATTFFYSSSLKCSICDCCSTRHDSVFVNTQLRPVNFLVSSSSSWELFVQLSMGIFTALIVNNFDIAFPRLCEIQLLHGCMVTGVIVSASHQVWIINFALVRSSLRVGLLGLWSWRLHSSVDSAVGRVSAKPSPLQPVFFCCCC